MIYFLLVIFLLIVGLIIGALAGLIWKKQRPYGVVGDMLISIASTLVIGFLDWFIIPAMGFSNELKYLAVAMEPALGAVLVLWIVRKRVQR